MDDALGGLFIGVMFTAVVISEAVACNQIIDENQKANKTYESLDDKCVRKK